MIVKLAKRLGLHDPNHKRKVVCYMTVLVIAAMAVVLHSINASN